MEQHTYSVSEVNRYISGIFDGDPFLSNVRIEGEMSRITVQGGSGHMYFALKDDDSTIDAKMWRTFRQRMNFVPKMGDKVVVTGTVDVYEKTGRYSITAKKIERAGEGDIYQKLLELKKELAEMGMFDEQYKRPIPKYARRIGVVTAKTGAVIHDIMVNAKRKNPYVEIVLYPTLVQGEGAAEQIAQGIRTLDDMGFDVLIVGRGGGSVEDLWAFNERIVAEAIFSCQTPVIAAVGHEIDTSIANLVADLAVSTPTAAAEAATFSYEEFLSDLEGLAEDLEYRMAFALREAHNRLGRMEAVLSSKSPAARLMLYRQRQEHLTGQMEMAMQRRLELAKERQALLAVRLDEKSPAKRLSDGYAFATAADGRRIKRSADVNIGDEISLHLHEGSLKASVTDIIN